jgi:hypothetical protein
MKLFVFIHWKMEGIVDLPRTREMLAEDLSVLRVAGQERDDDLRDLLD